MSSPASARPFARSTSLRIAHSHDLFALGNWHLWQRDCFASERVQPFKQVFRELYVLTAAEKAEGAESLRYAGQQVHPQQALALLGARGWVNHPEEGVSRTFHDAGLTACLDVMGLTFSPADVEGVTIESVQFVKRGEWRPTPLDEIPPRIFSEAMRDLDLVVSVAHRGGVDPEASASTIEMRGSLLRETCSLLRLENVRVKESRALIEVHPAEARAGLKKGGHADSIWSCIKRLQTRRSACPPVSCTMHSGSAATGTGALSTRTAK